MKRSLEYWIAAVVLSGVLIVVGDTCTPSVSSCLASNCIGCCDSSQNCQPGNTNAVCGGNGGQCVACTPGTTCELGSCAPSACGPGTCNGCCDASGQCQSPSTGAQANAACGSNGGACSVCNSAQTCDSHGVCQNQVTCGPGTCTGCCNQGACIPTLSETDQFCGSTRGGACSACQSGNTCQSGACAPPDSGCTNCQGCCNAGQCLLTASEDDQHCGSTTGAACAPCTTGNTCQSGACLPPPPCANCQGCCDAGTCFTVSQEWQSNQYCGSVTGQACSTCANGCSQGACNSAAAVFAQSATGASDAGTVNLVIVNSVGPSTGSAPANAPVLVTAYVTPHNGGTLDGAWTNNNFTSSTGFSIPAPVASGGNDLYSLSIPGQDAGTTVRFFLHFKSWSGTDSYDPLGFQNNYTYVTQ